MKAIHQRMALLVATAGHTGRIPWAPGTLGSLWGVGLHLLTSPLCWQCRAFFTVALVVLACWSAQHASEILGDKDPSQVVIDEVAGMYIGLVGIDPGLAPILLAFVLFRTFDILKPFPVRQLEGIPPAGLGIVMDDVAAGILCNASWRILEGLHVW